MEEKYFIKIQKRITGLLKKRNSECLQKLAKDNCSELSRLAGCWILTERKKSVACILKGKDIMNKKGLNHDILILEENRNVFLIDPSIWQFFKDKKNILIGKFINKREALIYAKEFYGGKWKVSEIIEKKHCSNKNTKEWQKIIKQNILEINPEFV